MHSVTLWNLYGASCVWSDIVIKKQMQFQHTKHLQMTVPSICYQSLKSCSCFTETFNWTKFWTHSKSVNRVLCDCTLALSIIQIQNQQTIKKEENYISESWTFYMKHKN